MTYRTNDVEELTQNSSRKSTGYARMSIGYARMF